VKPARADRLVTHATLKSQMKTNTYLLALGLGLALAGPLHAAAPPAACAKVVLGAGPDYPPLHWYDGASLRGASVRLTQKIFADMGVPVELRYVGPFPRLMANAQRGQIDVVATLKRTPEREAFLTFTTVAAFSNPVSVFVARKRGFRYAGWDDLIGHTGGIATGTRFGEPFDTFLLQKLRIETSSSLESNFRKLAVGRIDYLVTGYYNGLAYLEAHQQQDQFVALQPPVNESENHIAFYSKSPCMRHFMEFDRRLALLVKSGAPDRMIQAALLEWRADPRTVR
jgi:polar amino acid transport system substrate-binding protein